MVRKRLVILAVLASALISSSAFAGVSFSVVGAGDYGLWSTTVSGLTEKGTIGYGGGALIDFGFSPRAAFEIGGIYLHQQVKADGTILGVDVSTTTGFDSIYAPANFVFGLSPGFSLLLGGYYKDFTASGGGHDDGVQGGFRFGTHNPGSNFFVDARYSQSLKDDQNNIKENNVMILIGLMFGSAR
jgi:hypothetical protein